MLQVSLLSQAPFARGRQEDRVSRPGLGWKIKLWQQLLLKGTQNKIINYGNNETRNSSCATLCIHLGQKGRGSITCEMEGISSQPSDLCSITQHDKETFPSVHIDILQELPLSYLEDFLSGVSYQPVLPPHTNLKKHKILTLEL